MIVVPWSHDQPDNAHRIEQLGVGRTLLRKRYDAPGIMRELNELLKTPSYAERARDLGQKITGEDGVAHACDAIEALLTKR
jgi:rhamnosyltransferase subunit B